MCIYIYICTSIRVVEALAATAPEPGVRCGSYTIIDDTIIYYDILHDTTLVHAILHHYMIYYTILYYTIL